MSKLPDCGLYRTVQPIGSIPAGRLVYFHNHGDPGPGFYFPEAWAHNRARFGAKGTTAPADLDARALRRLPAEGFYRVAAPFHCCEKKCVRYEIDALVQLGYNGTGQALVFTPEVGAAGVTLPERGTVVDDAAFANLVQLKVNDTGAKDDHGGGNAISMPRGIIFH